MKTNFICPKCDAHLLVGDKIIFTAITKKDNRRGLILLSPKIGEYANVIHPTFKIEEGEEIDFYCPVCHGNLIADNVDEKLVKIIMVDDKNDKYEIYFSGVNGEQCTYKVSDEKFEKYGVASEKYLKYFVGHRI